MYCRLNVAIGSRANFFVTFGWGGGGVGGGGVGGVDSGGGTVASGSVDGCGGDGGGGWRRRMRRSRLDSGMPLALDARAAAMAR